MGFKQWQRLPENSGLSDYKRDYCPTEAFRTHRAVVYAELEDILRISYRKPDDFNAIEPSELLGASGANMDFNDAYFAAFCRLNNLILVTNDRDLLNTPLNVRILTD